MRLSAKVIYIITADNNSFSENLVNLISSVSQGSKEEFEHCHSPEGPEDWKKRTPVQETVLVTSVKELQSLNQLVHVRLVLDIFQRGVSLFLK